jgi:ketosteroid isomerase-like protein
MRVGKLFGLIWTACIVVQGCANDNRSPSSSDSEAITTQLIEIYNIPYSGLSTDEMADNHLRFFAKDPTILPPNQSAIVGYQPIADLYYGAYQEIEFVSNTYRDLEIVVHGDMATRRFIGTGVFRIAGQPDPVTSKNRYLDVLVREDDEWKILLHSWVPVSGE